jgi:hypothetical protein
MLHQPRALFYDDYLIGDYIVDRVGLPAWPAISSPHFPRPAQAEMHAQIVANSSCRRCCRSGRIFSDALDTGANSSD